MKIGTGFHSTHRFNGTLHLFFFHVILNGCASFLSSPLYRQRSFRMNMTIHIDISCGYSFWKHQISAARMRTKIKSIQSNFNAHQSKNCSSTIWLCIRFETSVLFRICRADHVFLSHKNDMRELVLFPFLFSPFRIQSILKMRLVRDLQQLVCTQSLTRSIQFQRWKKKKHCGYIEKIAKFQQILSFRFLLFGCRFFFHKSFSWIIRKGIARRWNRTPNPPINKWRQTITKYRHK